MSDSLVPGGPTIGQAIALGWAAFDSQSHHAGGVIGALDLALPGWGMETATPRWIEADAVQAAEELSSNLSAGEGGIVRLWMGISPHLAAAHASLYYGLATMAEGAPRTEWMRGYAETTAWLLGTSERPTLDIEVN